MIKKIIYTLSISLLIFSCNNKESKDLEVVKSNKAEEKISLKGKDVLVYTTAQNTDKRLSLDSNFRN